MTTSAITNYQRLLFMSALSKNVRSEDGLLLDSWEKRFLNSFLNSSRPSLWFIGERIKWTDALWRKYGGEIKMPFPLSDAAPTAIPVADPGCCMFLMRDEEATGRLRRCNDPAAVTTERGFLYCQAHEESVQRDLRRRGGKTMIVSPYKPK